MPEQREYRALALFALLLGGVTAVAGELQRDPTRPYSVREQAVVAKPQYRVNAIIVSHERRIAIVNGKRVTIGEQVNGATVVSISKQELILDVSGQRVTLQLNSAAPPQ